MKIILIGADNENSIETYYVKHLSKFLEKDNLIFLKTKNIFNKYYYKSALNKIIFRVGFSGIFYRINKIIKKTINIQKPDVVIVFKGMEIFPSTIKWIKSKSIKTINYNTDNPFYFTGKGSGNINIRKSLGLYDLLLTYDTTILKTMKETITINSKHLPFGYDQIYSQTLNVCDEILRVCFIGNVDSYRLFFLNSIAEAGIQIDLYGEWNSTTLHKNIQYLGKLPHSKLCRTIHQYRIQLNVLREHNKNSHNMRTFEIPSNGGIQLAPATEDHTEFFSDNNEIFLYHNYEDCVNKIQLILNMSFDKIQQIRKQARERCVNSGYSYEHRSALLYSYLKNDL